ncbi:uncharacterized protein si:ch73-170d6.3 [Danio rerio]|uniref:Si:ch73-170d6.3 n=1 Tax=Danio rerio TaxID=7955 RepID=A0A0G2LAF7_DANRE|nr:uncharacterized protein si:ch73-170d6.3 [Danio rerio]|eukprot:XP_002662199.3 uncharacterized protein si:ch73-170d6.3 [Danio rerio]
MFGTVWFSLCCLFGVFGVTDELSLVSVLEGDSVTLHADREMRNNDLILWRFGPENTLIVQINVTESSLTVNEDYDGRFRGSVKVDHQTGCLTITNTRTEHAGRYQLQSGNRRTFFILVVYGDLAEKGEMKPVSVMEGESVSLHTDTELRKNDLIVWSFGKNRIAQINGTTQDVTVYDALQGIFTDRLNVDQQSGSLTITGTTTVHTGVYLLAINNIKKIFVLSVYACLPVPVIFSQCPPSSSQYSSVLCSAVNVSSVTLSWFKGNRLLSSISVSDFSSSLSLPLAVDYQDENTYSCVLNNSFSAQTQHLDASQLCSVRGCQTVEAVIRLVAAALVGVAASAAVVVLIYDIRSRRAEQD